MTWMLFSAGDGLLIGSTLETVALTASHMNRARNKDSRNLAGQHDGVL